MSDREMTPSEAIIILDRLNTEERIDVDRDELRAAVKVAKAAMQKQKARTPLWEISLSLECPRCFWMIRRYAHYCELCGQKLDWRNR